MEERAASWGEAFSTALNKLTGVDNGGSARVVRMLFIAIFALGTAWAGWSYYKAELAPDAFLAPKEYVPTPVSNTAQADQARLEKMLSDVRTTSQKRSESTVITDSMTVLARYPFSDPTLVVDPSKPDEITEEIVVVAPPIDYPPTITVRAIMAMGSDRIALMDITDVGAGMVVRAGDTFSSKKGRIVRITPEKVIIRWGGRNWDIAPSF